MTKPFLEMTNLIIVPFQLVTWEEDKAFVNSDPMDGKRWNQTKQFGVDWTPWDDIHPGTLNLKIAFNESVLQIIFINN